MRGWAIVIALVPVIDQTVKSVLRHRLGARTIPLGPFVSVRVTHACLWWTRVAGVWSLTRLWTLWSLAAIALVGVGMSTASAAPFVALLLGGSLSHGLEVSRRGRVEDYICSTFWPAFNLADVAITAGALGVVVHVYLAMRHLGA
jgi:signal peptidase II